MEQNKIKINLKSIEKINKFGHVVRRFMSDVRVVNDSKDLDAKSILGMFDVNLYKDIYVYIISDNTEEIRQFDAAMEEFR